MNLPKKLVEKRFLEPHRKKFICNYIFYMPPKKEVDNLYKIYFSSIDNSLEDKKSNTKKYNLVYL